jgi:hypothetical protein
MPEELSSESKLYIKEEIDKIRKDFKEDLKEAQAKATKTFATIALIVGVLASLGVYYSAREYIDSEVGKRLDAATVQKIEDDLKKLSDLKTDLEKHQLAKPNGYASIGGIKIMWGTSTSSADVAEPFDFGSVGFPNTCFAVVTSLAGKVEIRSKQQFTLDRINDYKGSHQFTYVAIGN